jgi:hypothetical protein
MPFTITGTFNSDVWLEYSTNGGSTWTRLSTLFTDATTIVTDDLPTNIDLKIRLVAFCNESLISNVLDYDYVENFSFQGTEGVLSCNSGFQSFEDLNPKTLYCASSALSMGISVYDDISLSTLTTISGFRNGTTVYEISSGIITLVNTIGNGC